MNDSAGDMGGAGGWVGEAYSAGVVVWKLSFELSTNSKKVSDRPEAMNCCFKGRRVAVQP